MKIHVLALDGAFDTGLATVLDVFTTANELAGMLGIGEARFDVSVVGMRKTVHTSQGLRVPVMSLPECGDAEWFVIPAIGEKMADGLQVALRRRDIADAAAMLRMQAERGTRFAAACI